MVAREYTPAIPSPESALRELLVRTDWLQPIRLDMEHNGNGRDASAHKAQFSGKGPAAAKAADLANYDAQLSLRFVISAGKSCSFCYALRALPRRTR